MVPFDSNSECNELEPRGLSQNGFLSLSLFLSFPPSLPLALSPSRPLSLSPSLSLPLPLPMFLPLPLSLPLPHSVTSIDKDGVSCDVAGHQGASLSQLTNSKKQVNGNPLRIAHGANVAQFVQEVST